MIHSVLICALVSLVPFCSSIAIYQQCGGEGYKGATNCDWPLRCFRRSRWFSSCQTSCPAADWDCAKAGGTSAGGLAKAWEQCGGDGWNGPRACAQYPCHWRTKWYAQCRPDCPVGWMCQGSVASSSTGASTKPSVTSTLTPVSSSIEPGLVVTTSTGDSREEIPGWQLGNVTDNMLGRRIVAHMLGSDIFDGILSAIDSPQNDDAYDLVVNHILELLESEQPGSLANFGLAMQSESVDERIEAWAAMSKRVETMSDSSELVAVLLLDPLFWELMQASEQLEASAGETRSSRATTRGCPGSIPNIGLVNGKYGDGKEGLIARAADMSQWLTSWFYERDLHEIDYAGKRPADMESRLGAYYITRTYQPDTVGHAVHSAIGEIYRWLGPVGEERIGRVFNDKRAIALYKDSIHSSSNLCMAQIEYRYWANVYAEDPTSIGGQLGSMFKPTIRDCIQKYLPKIRDCLQLSLNAIDRCVSSVASAPVCELQSSRSATERASTIPAGYTKTNYRCMNKPVYCNSKASNGLACIVEDRTSHNGGVWKAGPEKAWAEKGCPTGQRSGTYDANLQWIAA